MSISHLLPRSCLVCYPNYFSSSTSIICRLLPRSFLICYLYHCSCAAESFIVSYLNHLSSATTIISRLLPRSFLICYPNHISSSSGRFSFGQNIAQSSGNLDWNKAISNWANEKNVYTYNGDNGGKVVGHYTQVRVVW
ncbi:hypothetical protein DPMN_086788 [Dreissena polymorpha]|uniref:SCP domain-containing protein n=1 Tax=Dreissena polymorpha TaxID=45954 RepID=A0A9D4QV08_DREPO|nr:hypothetical protein DPMN_086788 [Dreissena polymorpha]